MVPTAGGLGHVSSGAWWRWQVGSCDHGVSKLVPAAGAGDKLVPRAGVEGGGGASRS